MEPNKKRYTGSLIGLMSNKVKTYGGINMAQGIPAFNPPARLIDQMKIVMDQTTHQYAPGKGHINLVKWLKDHYQLQSPLTNDHILMVNGATEGLSLLYTYLNQLIQDPYGALAFGPVYESYRELPKIFGQTFIEYQNKDRVLDIDNLKEVIIQNKVKLLFMASPGNPWGHIWSKDELTEICNLADHLDFYIIFDAVYSELYFQEVPHQLVDISNKRLFYVNSFSKMLSITGWRVGYLIAHEQHMQKISNMHDYIGLCVSHPAQAALSAYLNESEDWKSYVSDIRDKLRSNYQLAEHILRQAGFKIPSAQGGYFIWCQLPNGINDGLNFALDLYEQQKVAVVPGEHFSSNASDFIRINLAMSKEVLEKGLIELIDFTKSKA
ncbi:MAG: pyridoxal phosphate-dependent aminotransferase [Marinilabiliaceae bacterium]|nr:pyridoxal phosphate-dependent aminotransferase [Marinilabiliaceae bacterium]